MKNYYQILGVNKDASQSEIKKAYRKLAMKYHPDRTAGDKALEEKFKEIQEAHEVLTDERKRAAYDQYGHAGVDPNRGGGGFGGGGFGGGGAFHIGFDDPPARAGALDPREVQPLLRGDAAGQRRGEDAIPAGAVRIRRRYGRRRSGRRSMRSRRWMRRPSMCTVWRGWGGRAPPQRPARKIPPHC